MKDVRTGFGPALLGGLAQLGPVEPFSGDLSLELGISVWLRTSGTSLLQARSSLLEIRQVILEVCALDPATEPVPLVGRSPRSDVVNLVGYISELLRRASAGRAARWARSWRPSWRSCPCPKSRRWGRRR